MTRWLLDLLNRHWHREYPETQDDPRLYECRTDPLVSYFDDRWPTVRDER